jgi:hypothetical protein
MQRIWKYIYLCWAIICLASGYRLLAPDRTAYFRGVPWPDIAMFFLFWCIAPLAVMVLNFHGLDVTFRRPSLDRPPWGRRHDPLQLLRLGLVSALSTLIGGCFALAKADQRGIMMFVAITAASLGFLIGERLVYWVYAKKITKSAGLPKSEDSK